MKSASSPCPVNRAMCRHRLVFRDVPTTQEKPMHFAWFLCLGRTVRTTKSRIPKPTSGHLCSFVCFVVSRGRIRILTLRCPEVRLEFSLLGVQRLENHFQVSRGRISIFNSRLVFSRCGCGCGAVDDFEYYVLSPRSRSTSLYCRSSPWRS